MTTSVYVFSQYIMSGKKLQVLRRNASTGAETLVIDDLTLMSVANESCWDGADIIIREVDK